MWTRTSPEGVQSCDKKMKSEEHELISRERNFLLLSFCISWPPCLEKGEIKNSVAFSQSVGRNVTIISWHFFLAQERKTNPWML